VEGWTKVVGGRTRKALRADSTTYAIFFID
jgi:hypothetical protein